MEMADRESIRVEMERIAQRRPGRTRLVYDRQRRTIVSVTDEQSVKQGEALGISAEDADMI